MMGKRQVVVVSSSDDEDGNCLGSATCGSSKSTLRTRAARKKSKASKKVVGLDTQLCNESHKLEPNFDKLFEDFCGGLQVNVVPGYGWRDTKELWADKYKPRSLPDLAVHKKKIDEVKKWLEERVRNSKEDFHNHALLITGQAGVGKSATIHAIASQLGAELYEWKAPTPTLWQEHIHDSSSENARVMVLAATNLLSELDEAILRRLPQPFEIGVPNYSERAKILQVILKGEQVEDDIDYDCIARLLRVTLVEICLNSASKQPTFL